MIGGFDIIIISGYVVSVIVFYLESGSIMYGLLVGLLIQVMVLLLFLPAVGSIMLTYFAALAYRFSLKSTAFIWLPLLYIADDISPSSATVDRRLDRISTSAAGSLARAYALFAGLLLLLKFVTQIVSYKVLVGLIQMSSWLTPLEPLVKPVEVPVWQVLSILNAIIAWSIYLYADWELSRRKYKSGCSDLTVEKILGTTILVRWMITCYTTICTVYIVYEIAKNSDPVPRIFTWTPWK